MKKTGLIILAIGVIMTLLSGFNLITREKVVDIGVVQINHNKSHRLNWSPWIGAAVIAVGAGIILFGRRSQNPIHISK